MIKPYKNITSIFPARFLVAMALMVLLKLFLTSARQMSVIDSGYDSLLYIKLAYALRDMKWLGDYTSLTLIKGPVYPFFIAVNSYLGLPLLFTQGLLYCISIFIAVVALSPMLKNNWWRLFLFALLLFSPESYSAFTTAIARGNLNISLNLMVFAGFIAVFLRPERETKTWIVWMIFAGITLFLHQNTREENIIILPFILMLSVVSIVNIFRKKVSSNTSIEKASLLRAKLIRAGLLTMPYIILIIGNLSLASLNYLKYGGFIRNEIKSKAFAESMRALTSIETENWIINVPVSHEARLKAYKVSPAFSELRPVLEDENNGWKAFGEGVPDEIKGGWFLWAYREAAAMKGHHSTLQKSQQFYRQVAAEIDAAFENGQLPKKNIFSLFSFTWDNRFLNPTLHEFGDVLFFVIRYDGFSPYPIVSLGDAKTHVYFQDITGEIANVGTIDEINQHLPSRMKFSFLNKLARIYSFINPVLFFAALVLYLAASVLLIFKKKWNGLFQHWLIASVLLFFGLTRLLLIAFMSISQFKEAVHMYYLSTAYPVFLLFGLLMIHIFTIPVIQRKLSLKLQ